MFGWPRGSLVQRRGSVDIFAMALPGMMAENHYDREDERALRAANGGRAVVRRERTVVDAEMGQAHLIGGSSREPELGAWACMTHMPFKAPERPPRIPAAELAAANPPPSPPKYDAAGEAARKAAALRERERWENADNVTALPRGDDKALGAHRLHRSAQSCGRAGTPRAATPRIRTSGGARASPLPLPSGRAVAAGDEMPRPRRGHSAEAGRGTAAGCRADIRRRFRRRGAAADRGSPPPRPVAAGRATRRSRRTTTRPRARRRSREARGASRARRASPRTT